MFASANDEEVKLYDQQKYLDQIQRLEYELN